MNEKNNLEVFNVAKKKLSIFRNEVGYNPILEKEKSTTWAKTEAKILALSL